MVEKWRCDRVCGVAVRGVRHTVVAGDVERELSMDRINGTN